MLDEDGEPVPEPDIRKWGAWFEAHLTDRHVADSTVCGVRVSTVFLALDNNFGGGPPILWETMLFFAEGYDGPLDVDDEYMWRYSSRGQALAHHDQLVAALRDGAKVLPSP